ncbi:hypothetical protein QAD02_002772 [Eretmocerus hayati]|uniref:Uncharacterized protein n=1 Tax=Eretmocerus hayati TaxID=131215 RepID=A0ACC2NJZ2_9HYME|nr:hypothetical protein QAD02_002772 [Eretmocerus hayati]
MYGSSRKHFQPRAGVGERGFGICDNHRTQCHVFQFRIGSGFMNNLIISDRSIEEQHCQLQRRNGQWSVTREPGQMSVYVQGTEEVKEGQSTSLFDGQVIQVGECCCFTYQIGFYFWDNQYPKVAILKVDSIRRQKHNFVSSSLNMERELTRRILIIQ